MSVADAWQHGTNVQTAMRVDPVNTRKQLVTLIANVCTYYKAKATLSTVQEYAFAVESLIELYPAMKLEEWAIVCQRMMQGRYGKYFERVQVAEFSSAMLAHESERLPHLEQSHVTVTRGADDLSKSTYKPTSMKELRRKQNLPIFKLAEHLADQQNKRDAANEVQTEEET